MKKLTKKGSYIVEAVIVMPIFIIAVIMLISIVPIISTCEKATFVAADEMRVECLKSGFRKNPLAFPTLFKHRMYGYSSNLSSCSVAVKGYMYSERGIDDLICERITLQFKRENPVAVFSSVKFEGTVAGRAFTGKYNKQGAATKDEFERYEKSERVYIFPNWGNRYHGKYCTYVKGSYSVQSLSGYVKSRYHGCQICNSNTAGEGDMVFCFQNGGAYHFEHCRTIDRYYVEIEKIEAEEKGYTPCEKCGGG